MEPPLKVLHFTNAIGLSAVAFASYFDVYSHAHIFVGVDPWWNPAHLMLYAGFATVAYGALRGGTDGAMKKLSLSGIAIAAAAAAFNEVWHRVLLFGNPLPEPFAIEPPHALLAVGFLLLGLAALLGPLRDRSLLDDTLGRACMSFITGSFWLIAAGSALYVGAAYPSDSAFLFAVAASSFAASLFLKVPTGLTGRFGYTTLSYAWFMLVYYIFFVSPADGPPLGLVLVAGLDLVLSRGKAIGLDAKLAVIPVVALLYGVVYYPILPASLTLTPNAGLVASTLGVCVEAVAERAVLLRIRRWPEGRLR